MRILEMSATVMNHTGRAYKASVMASNWLDHARGRWLIQIDLIERDKATEFHYSNVVTMKEALDVALLLIPEV